MAAGFLGDKNLFGMLDAMSLEELEVLDAWLEENNITDNTIPNWVY